MIHEYFPEAFIQLQLEISHHPLLVQRIQKHNQADMETIFAEVAYYCGYAINGTYQPAELIVLADQFIEDLKKLAVKEAIKGLSHDWGKEAWKFGVQ